MFSQMRRRVPSAKADSGFRGIGTQDLRPGLVEHSARNAGSLVTSLLKRVHRINIVFMFM